MKFIPKSQLLLDKIYQWNLDDEMRLDMGGSSIPIDKAISDSIYDAKYEGTVNQLVGVLSDSNVIRGCYFLERDLRHNRANLHFAFDEEGRGKLLKESASAIVDYCFNELSVGQLFGEIASSNEKAIKFVLNMGWEEAATLPEYYSTKDGFVDCKVFRLIRDNRRF